ncbi:histone lysine demethylase PHF8-like isoform X2 [Gigantopelta aegis]|uniref:histone lysine demethylase PHF8-like isoform X2 n=1 Tax=Gigantopelta aegis TaxID=1735272 RepID=UPI001B88DD64|nr:histone lysine demethylase PHF8-like isoform X2 [Gigantopelta aegis]
MASDTDDTTVYCLCRLPYDETRFMIECDVCKDWFHGGCVGVQEHQASDIEIYHCPNCQVQHGPLVLKKRRNWHRHDYSEEDSAKAVQTGTVAFTKELKNRSFPGGDDIPITRLHGSQLTIDYFENNGLEVPILVEKKEGLGLTVPPSNFSIQDVENHVGSMREIDVIDVARQEDYKMLMREWTEYYNSPNRHKIFNVISLEFSNTKLSELVVPPLMVRQLSWVQTLWPDQLPEDSAYSRPEVQKYCLMGVRDSFTDFHIDFGGTSVWYHVLRGEKVFYLIRPTNANMALYETWVSSSSQSETFFGDQVDDCYKCVVKQGQTMFIPTGWIHAVFTPIDSLVFGGNFLHSYQTPLQLECYEIERRVKTPEKYLFPYYETVCWYAAKHFLEYLKACREDGKMPKKYMFEGARALPIHLRGWTQRKDFAKQTKSQIPEQIQYGRLLKELIKEVKHFEVQQMTQKKSSRKKKKQQKERPTPQQMLNIDLLHQHTQEKLKQVQKQHDQNVYNFEDEPEPLPPSLKVRIPKAGAYLDSTIELETKMEPVEADKKEPLSALKLKVSNGKIVSDKSNTPTSPGKFQKLTASIEARKEAKKEKSDKKSKSEKKDKKSKSRKSKSKEHSKDKPTLKIKEIVEPSEEAKFVESVKKEVENAKRQNDPDQENSRDSDQDALIVDEHPKKRKAEHVSTTKPGSLKLKLSTILGKGLPDTGQHSTSPLSKPSTHSDSKAAIHLDSKPLIDLDSKTVKSSDSKTVKSSDSKTVKSSDSKTVKTSDSKTVKTSDSKTVKTSDSKTVKISDSKTVKTSDSKTVKISDSKTVKISDSKTVKTSDSKTVKTSDSKPIKLTDSKTAKLLASKSGKTFDSKLGKMLDSKAVKGSDSKRASGPCGKAAKAGKGSESKSTPSSPDSSDEQSLRMNLPTIRGGLNGSIADILEASGYGTETDFKIDEEAVSGTSSPSMRDAIQGMLSMSRGGDSDLFPGKKGGSGHRFPKRWATTQAADVDEEEKMMADYYRDDEYVYPTLEDLSDDEGTWSSRKPKKKEERDDTWNPKARVSVGCPRVNRPHRPDARKESVETNLAQTAAKLTESPPETLPRKMLKKAKLKPEKKESTFFSLEPQPGTSNDSVNAFRPGIKREASVPDSPTKAPVVKKPRKGQATAKQRLGKILKIHKMMF